MLSCSLFTRQPWHNRFRHVQKSLWEMSVINWSGRSSTTRKKASDYTTTTSKEGFPNSCVSQASTHIQQRADVDRRLTSPSVLSIRSQFTQTQSGERHKCLLHISCCWAWEQNAPLFFLSNIWWEDNVKEKAQDSGEETMMFCFSQPKAGGTGQFLVGRRRHK